LLIDSDLLLCGAPASAGLCGSAGAGREMSTGQREGWHPTALACEKRCKQGQEAKTWGQGVM